MAQPEEAPVVEEEEPKTAEFLFVRGNDYRIVHSDGAWGGVTPTGQVSVAFYAEYREEPATVTVTLSPTAGLVESGRTGRQAIRRDLQVNVLMSESGARGLLEWLQKQLGALDDMKAKASALEHEAGNNADVG